MAAVLATARPVGPRISDDIIAAAPVRTRGRKLVCRWRRDPATGALRCVWVEDPRPRPSILHLRLVAGSGASAR